MTHKQDLKEYERNEKNNRDCYICNNPYSKNGLCGGLVKFNRKYKVWCCENCQVIITEKYVKKLSRIY